MTRSFRASMQDSSQGSMFDMLPSTSFAPRICRMPERTALNVMLFVQALPIGVLTSKFSPEPARSALG